MWRTKIMHLDYAALHRHFWDCSIGIVEMSTSQPALEKVVIRGEDGDYELAAIHREGNVLIFDLGQKVNGLA